MNRPGTYSSSLARIFTQAAQRTTALGAVIVVGRQLGLLARDVIRDRPTLRLVLRLFIGNLQLHDDLCDGDLAGFQRQLKLLDRLRRGAEPMVAVTRQLVAQLRCQQRLRLHLGQQERREASQVLGIFRQGFGNVQHGPIILE